MRDGGRLLPCHETGRAEDVDANVRQCTATGFGTVADVFDVGSVVIAEHGVDERQIA